MSLLIGFLAGVFGGIAGVGGGAVMIPMMVGILKLSQHRASGTSLVTLVFTGIAGTIAYAANGHVDFLAAFLLAVTAIFSARAGARFSHSLPEATLRRFYGAFLIFIALSMVLKPWLPHVSSPLTGWAKVLILLAAGIFTGFQSGIMGGGGGAVSIPAMVLLAGFSQHMAQGDVSPRHDPGRCHGRLDILAQGKRRHGAPQRDDPGDPHRCLRGSHDRRLPS